MTSSIRVKDLLSIGSLSVWELSIFFYFSLLISKGIGEIGERPLHGWQAASCWTNFIMHKYCWHLIECWLAYMNFNYDQCHKKKEIAMLLCYYKNLATSQLELGFSLQCQGTFEISFFLSWGYNTRIYF